MLVSRSRVAIEYCLEEKNERKKGNNKRLPAEGGVIVSFVVA